MIDWPRTKVMRHLLTGHNVGLIARRQMLPEGECNFFWVTDSITIDGVIRSDNRGSEVGFSVICSRGRPQGRRETANFSEAFVQAAREILPDRPLTPEPASRSLGSPTRWLGYLYAQFHSPSYRSRYADLLRIDFPRVFLTPDAALWDELAELGTRLMALHLGPHSTALSQLRGPAVADEPRQAVWRAMGRSWWQPAIRSTQNNACGSRRTSASRAFRRRFGASAWADIKSAANGSKIADDANCARPT